MTEIPKDEERPVILGEYIIEHKATDKINPLM